MKLRTRPVKGVLLRIQAKTGLCNMLLAVAAGMEPAAAVNAGLNDVGECPRARTRTGCRGTTHPAVAGKSQERRAKNAWEQERIFEGRDYRPGVKRTCGIVSSQGDGIRVLQACKCNIEGCGNQLMQFKTTQLLFEVAHDVEGGRTRAVCFDCWEN